MVGDPCSLGRGSRRTDGRAGRTAGAGTRGRGHRGRGGTTVFRNEILFFCNGKADEYSDHERGGLVRLGVDRLFGMVDDQDVGGAAFSLPAFWG